MMVPIAEVHIDEGGAVQRIHHNTEIVLRVFDLDDLFLLLGCDGADKPGLFEAVNKHPVRVLVKRHLLFAVHVPGLLAGW